MRANDRRSIPPRVARLMHAGAALAGLAALGAAAPAADGAAPTPAATTVASPAAAPRALDVASYTDAGRLRRPEHLETWVFLGASLGMGYSQAGFDPNSPGMFQVVLMEPTAYAEFVRTGEYPDGAMFLLSFYGAEQRASINRSGFTQGELRNFEIHLYDRRRAGEHHAFYPFQPQDATAAALPPKNACIECHERDGAFRGTFAQFYPVIRERLAPR